MELYVFDIGITGIVVTISSYLSSEVFSLFHLIIQKCMQECYLITGKYIYNICLTFHVWQDVIFKDIHVGRKDIAG